jgi:hypothetical protein
LLLLVFALDGSAVAQKSCSTVKDETLRLQCYDSANTKRHQIAKPETKKKKNSEEVAVETPEMSQYVARIDKAFLESGINITVSVVTRGYTESILAHHNVPYPALTFFGYISRATAYAITTKLLNSFAEARSLGFKTVDFHDKAGGNGRYVFDLRKPAPTCSRDLCF